MNIRTSTTLVFSLAMACSSGGGGDGTDGAAAPADRPGDGVTTQVTTGLPKLPALSGVTYEVHGDAVDVAFAPLDGAADYRIYPLPDDTAISVGADGLVGIKDAIYRCAGMREAPLVHADAEPNGQSEETHTVVQGFLFNGDTAYARTMADATLGYVYADPGDGRTAVYALGDPKVDTISYSQRWNESRGKEYTTSKPERDQRVAEGWRDDGIPFYVPSQKSELTTTVYRDTSPGCGAGFCFDALNLFYTEGPEKAARARAGDATKTRVAPAFEVLANPVDGALPLMRVFYQNVWHDELVAGRERFTRAYHQGTGPMWALHWSGIERPTTLVVEALDGGCPFQGHAAATSLPKSNERQGAASHQRLFTLDELRASAPNGEVFVNGQYDTTVFPRAVARAFLKVSPAARPDFDWYAGFGASDPAESFVDQNDQGSDQGARHFRSANYDLSAFALEDNDVAMKKELVYGNVLGEWWITYADAGSDTGAKIRLSPLQKAKLADDSFLHVTMAVDSVSTGRRYPQILVSDREAPVQNTLAQGNTLVIETIGEWPTTYNIEVCDHRQWDVNHQCPKYTFNRQSGIEPIPPIDEVSELAGVDRSTTFDAYLSGKRAYLLLNGKPYGCADLPAAGIPKGDVSVSFGDVLYHSGVDVSAQQSPPRTYDFHYRHLYIETARHFDNLGFKSGVAAPAWNEQLVPCRSASSMDTGQP